MYTLRNIPLKRALQRPSIWLPRSCRSPCRKNVMLVNANITGTYNEFNVMDCAAADTVQVSIAYVHLYDCRHTAAQELLTEPTTEY